MAAGWAKMRRPSFFESHRRALPSPSSFETDRPLHDDSWLRSPLADADPWYLIIFGSAVGTEGHTGRHTADDYFHILTGQQRCYAAGDLEPLIYNPGDVNLMKRGIVRQYWMEGETWALEYAAGWIPPMLPFGLADMLSSTLDYISFYHTCRITAREMIKNLLRGKI